jgi:hypothetical protein
MVLSVNDHGHVHRLVVTHDLEGWEVREEQDAVVLRRARRRDWHRVESDVELFEMAFEPGGDRSGDRSCRHDSLLENC